MLLKFVVFVGLIFKVSAGDNKCPEHVETMTNFNSELYLGDWYGTLALYNGDYYEMQTPSCSRASYKKLSMCFFFHWIPKTNFSEVKLNLISSLHRK